MKPVLDESHLNTSEEILSPYLPDTNIQYAWDSTSLGLLKTCPRLYYYIMRAGWSAREESIHLRFGIEFHQALQDFDIFLAQGMDRTDAVRETIKALHTRVYEWHVDRDTKAGGYKNRDTIIQLICDYLDFYNPDPAKTYILQNGKPAVELSFRFELDFGPSDSQPYILSGHLDRVVEFQDELFVMDRKTSTYTLSGQYFKQWEPNNQMTLYTLAGKMILNSPIKGVIIDAAQLLKTEPNRFVRGITYRTQQQLDEWLDDLSMHLAVAKEYARHDSWPMNDTACDKFGGCRFREVCSKSPQVRDSFLNAKYDQLPPEERWNPLKPR